MDDKTILSNGSDDDSDQTAENLPRIYDPATPDSDRTVVNEDLDSTIVDMSDQDFLSFGKANHSKVYETIDSGGGKGSRTFIIIGLIGFGGIICMAVIVTVIFMLFGKGRELALGDPTDENEVIVSTATMIEKSTLASTKTKLPTLTPTMTLISTITHTPTLEPTVTSQWVIGDSDVRAVDGMEMMFVPAGDFIMGATELDLEVFPNEMPQHTVYLDAFWMDKFEVTNGQYKACLDAGGCTGELYYSTDSLNQHPVTYMNWYNAYEYCEWAGANLPTEAQWEKAARGTEGNYFPWGDSDIDCSKIQKNSCVGTTAIVGSHPAGASIYGIEDLAGNVWEWVLDWMYHGYYYYSPSENPMGPDSGEAKILRGGAWDLENLAVFLSYYRYSADPMLTKQDFGFRCVVTFEE